MKRAFPHKGASGSNLEWKPTESKRCLRHTRPRMMVRRRVRSRDPRMQAGVSSFTSSTSWLG
ncbi:hypothetical protein KSS87_022930 [Heliosperma pusillum]|nr:hypothetical protein KSS87_022930 [Heliosperma pusillum]